MIYTDNLFSYFTSFHKEPLFCYGITFPHFIGKFQLIPKCFIWCKYYFKNILNLSFFTFFLLIYKSCVKVLNKVATNELFLVMNLEI